MADTSIVPYFSLARKIAPIIVGGVEHLEEPRSYSAIDTDTHTSWRLVRPILSGIIEHNKISSCIRFEDFGRPFRIEAFMGTNSFRTRGLVIFDEKGQLIVHVVNALLGYDGNGPDLSRSILTLLGISEEMFSDIQAATDQRKNKAPSTPYTIIAWYDDTMGWTWKQVK